MRKEVKIGSKVIGDNQKINLVAELGVNHLGNFERAMEMIKSAHACGADLLKFQTYKSEKRYDTKNNPKAKEFIKNLSNWEFERSKEKELWDYAKSIKATVFTSPFDIESLEFAEKMESAAYKIAAFEITNHKLIKAISSTKKPIVISRGMCTLKEMDEAVNIFENHGSPYIILHTISSYPTLKTDSNLKMIHTLRERYSCPIGHSDHTRGVKVPPLAVAAGASIIEKHFTINPKLRESDNPFSIAPEELKEIRFLVDQAKEIMGSGNIEKIDTENFMWSFRRKSH